MPVIRATVNTIRVPASRGSPIANSPGARTMFLPLSSRHMTQSPVTKTSGPWPPCSVVQVLVATSYMLGAARAAQPSASMRFPAVANCRGSGAGTCTSDDGLSIFTPALSPVLFVDAKLSISLPQVAQSPFGTAQATDGAIANCHDV